MENGAKVNWSISGSHLEVIRSSSGVHHFIPITSIINLIKQLRNDVSCTMYSVHYTVLLCNINVI